MKIQNNISFKGELSFHQEKEANLPFGLEQYFQKGGEADRFVNSLDKDMKVSVYIPKKGKRDNIFLSMYDGLVGGDGVGHWELERPSEKTVEIIKGQFEALVSLTNNMIQRFKLMHEAGDMIKHKVIAQVNAMKLLK